MLLTLANIFPHKKDIETEEIWGIKTYKDLADSMDMNLLNQEYHKHLIQDYRGFIVNLNALVEEWQQKVKEVERKHIAAMKAWRDDLNRSTQMRFRYFKQATFFYRDIWTNDFISPEEASIWYLAYIRFLLNQKLGKDYIVRMGVPCSYEDIAEFRQRAYNLWMSAGKLVDHYLDLNAFLKADYKDLRLYGKYEQYAIDPTQPFDVRTEAQASLFAAVSNRRIRTKINILFDIGGGTTDIAVFHITPAPEEQLKILETISVPMGLNYIFEAYQKEHPNQSLEKRLTLYSNRRLVYTEMLTVGFIKQ